MKNAYKHADGIKVDSRRVVVDVERGRTVPNWRPMRLGGGLGLGRFSGDGADHKRPSREQQLAGHPRSEEPRTRRDHHADRDLEKSRERTRERDRGERTSARSHERTRDHELRGERYSDKDRDRLREKDQVRDRERDRGHDRDRRDKDKHRYPSRDYDRGRELERSCDRHGDQAGDRVRAGHKRGHDQLNEYYQEDPYGKMPANYQARPNSIEPVADEEIEEYMEGDYRFHQADN